jgi:hypothetical protein
MLKHSNSGRIAIALMTWLLVPPSLLAQDPVLLWGDTHVHTALSADSFIMGNRDVTPDVAYRFARGEPVIHPYHRARIQLEQPLDFIVVADHAETLGVLREIYYRGVQLEDPGIADRIKGWITEWRLRNLVDGGDVGAAVRSMVKVTAEPPAAAASALANPPKGMVNAEALRTKSWRESTRLADEYNDPGTFTTFIGWEWSSAPGAANLHRVVMTSADSGTANAFLPFSSDQSPYPADLWDWLERTSAATGAEFIAIPHNSNISKGYMFAEASLRGEPISAAYARTRLRWEPVVEVTQIKGDSETHPLFSPNDEFANFETYRYTFDEQYGPPRSTPQYGDYIRQALQRGLALEQRVGVNPYQFGLIGSTDTHTGLATTEEYNFGGKFAADSTPETKGGDDVKGVSGWSMSAQGLAAVWAEANTRDAILAAFRRREVYATTGPRIVLKFFGGWQYGAESIEQTDSRLLRQHGVPMGSVLPERTDDVAPTFVLQAQRDANEARLDRVQVIKGWIDGAGELREHVYDVAWSGERVLQPDGSLPAIGSTVDLTSGRYRNSIGADTLAVVWTDPDFDPALGAFYYARVLQIPTPRHLLLDALALGQPAPREGASVIQERAYSSPIWYSPP